MDALVKNTGARSPRSTLLIVFVQNPVAEAIPLAEDLVIHELFSGY